MVMTVQIGNTQQQQQTNNGDGSNWQVLKTAPPLMAISMWESFVCLSDWSLIMEQEQKVNE